MPGRSLLDCGLLLLHIFLPLGNAKPTRGVRLSPDFVHSYGFMPQEPVAPILQSKRDGCSTCPGTNAQKFPWITKILLGNQFGDCCPGSLGSVCCQESCCAAGSFCCGNECVLPTATCCTEFNSFCDAGHSCCFDDKGNLGGCSYYPTCP